MTTGIQSLIDSGSKVWLDSVDPDEVETNKARGITGATSNPIIISGLIESGRFDETLGNFFEQGYDDEQVAWQMTDHLVRHAQEAFEDTWDQSQGNDGYVSFELDPLLEDAEKAPAHAERVKQYIELANKWSAGHTNRMIKVPATAAGLEALEAIAAAGITINVTLVFTERQYTAARDAIWRGRQRFGQLDQFKSVYSIFISRVDVYTTKTADGLSDQAQGRVGLLNAKRLWQLNQEFWAPRQLKLDQEIIFASTGKKLDWQEEDYYVKAVAGDGIQTNPPETNAAVNDLGKTYSRSVDQFPPDQVIREIDRTIDVEHMENTLMNEGTKKFADPHKKLIGTISERREALAPTG